MYHLNTEQLQKKWKAVLEAPGQDKIKDPYRRSAVAQVLENTERSLTEAVYQGAPQRLVEAPIPVNFMGASSSDASTGNIDIFDPVLISLVRRSMPNMIAYDICGVQPMSGPTGLIFAMRSRYANQTHTENFYNEVNTAWSSVVTGANTLGQKHTGTLPGNSTQTSNLAADGLYNFGSGMSTAQAEALGTDSNTAWPEMSFSIEKVSVTAKSRKLKAEYTIELAQDLKAVHGLDAETELSNILSQEILAEINREVVRTINVTAKKGSLSNVTTAGFFDLDTDSNGRWMVEKFAGLRFHLEKECNVIAKETRRGRGNMMITSSDVAAALNMAGLLNYNPALLQQSQLTFDDTGYTFAGVLSGRIKVYIDPYTTGDYATMGYKGSNPYDAGLFYCPYVPLQMFKGQTPDTFTPKIGFATRYGMVANPFAEGLTAGAGALTKDSNVYYRRMLISNLM